MIRYTCLLALLPVSLCAGAQEAQRELRKFVVADIETRVPVRGAVVSTRGGYRDTTDYRGICYIPQTFDTLSVAKPGYLTERLIPREIADSTYLIPDTRCLGEVTVWGRNGDALAKALAAQARRDAKNTELNHAAGGVGIIIEFDFAKMLDKRYRKDIKHLRKTRQIFRKMDETDQDPIVTAYRQALEAQQHEAETPRPPADR